MAMLDTCVVVDFPNLKDQLPTNDLGLSAIVFAELSAGVYAAPPGRERAERQKRLTWAKTFFDPYPFDTDVAMIYGRLTRAVTQAGRQPRNRIADLMIAATAAAADVPLYTSNADDFVGLEQLVEIVVL